MATRAIKPKREDRMLAGWQSMPEQAPSLVRADQPTLARILAMAGVLLSAVGILAMLAPGWKLNYVVSPGWGFFCLTIGIGLLFFHAFTDGDRQFRVVYAVLACNLVLIGVALRLLPSSGGFGALFLPYGFPFLVLALVFLLAVIRHASDQLSEFLLIGMGALGGLMIAVGLFVGMFSPNFLAVQGLLLLILGLAYVSGFIGMQQHGSPIPYRAGLALGITGAVALAYTFLRLAWPWLTGAESQFLVPSGVILLAIGLLYVAVALSICSDYPLVVLFRRELASFFFSPIAHFVLIGMTAIGWLGFYFFIRRMLDRQNIEPIVANYIVDLIPVIVQIFVVPVLTMRLLSEEMRTGTLEQLLTAPLNEATIVVGKFLAVLVVYMLTWLPPWLFLVALRVMGADEFDYRPVLSFALALVATGGGFMAMGLFFSSLTRNQIIAAILTFVGMLFNLGVYLAVHVVDWSTASVWRDVFAYMSFLDLWMSTLNGLLAPRFLLFHLSVTVFFLYLTVKVLESRKWK